MKLCLTNGYEVEISRQSNTVLYKGLSEKGLEPPKVPMYQDDNGVWQENIFSQKYADAVTVHNKKVELSILDIMLKTVVEFNPEWIVTEDWSNFVEFMQNQTILPINDLELYFLKFCVFNNIIDQSSLANEAFLTEHRVYGIFGTVHIQREGVDIHRAYLKNTVDTQIEAQPIFVGKHQLVNPLDEYLSCIESNMSWADWYSNNYSLDQKASSVALHRLSKVRDIHTNDAMQIHAERESKRNSK